MLSRADNTETETSIRIDLRAIFVSLELSSNGCGANIGSRAKQEFWGLMWITRQALHSKFQVRFCF